MKIRAKEVEIEVEADEPGGDPLVLVMGIGAQLVHWPDGFVDSLRALGFRVIRMDHRDCGLSSNLRHLPIPDPRQVLLRAALGFRVAAPYTLGDMADDVAAVLDALDIERAHLLGVSMGGMIAQTFALKHAARARSLTSVMSTTGDRRYAFGAKPWALKALLGKPPRSREEAVERVVHVYTTIGSRTLPPDLAILRALGERSFDRGMNPAGFARHFAAIGAAGSRRAELGSLRVPSLVIHGTQDPLIPVAAGRATARAIPGARFFELADMGHDLPRPLWGAITSAVRSLASDAR